jgi:hypothetical protein
VTGAAAVVAGSWSIRTAGSLALEAVLDVDCCSCCAVSAASAASKVSNAVEVVAAASLGPTVEFGTAVSTEVGWGHRKASVCKQQSGVEASAVGNHC